jgi:ergothioneine biosynthesis protein EgtB
MTKNQSLAPVDRDSLLESYRRVRSETEALAAPITAEDAQLQSMPDASPTKWHLGHTTWFFETFLLSRQASYRPQCEEFKVLFNSYYNAVGEQHPRPRRGLLSRPSLDEVVDYRHQVDASMRSLFENASDEEFDEAASVIHVGLHHERQHQELMMTDILHAFWSNPLKPAYREPERPGSRVAPPLTWHGFDEGVYWVGAEKEGFAFDNEYPRHREFVHAFEIASREVTNAEFMEFVSGGGYARPEHWLSDGWATVRAEGWTAPLYWERRQGTWWQMTLYGMRPVDPHAPVCHVSYYEADAYARWSGARLPTEFEWEVAASGVGVKGNLQESDFLVPRPPDAADVGSEPAQMFGDVWEWTASAYLPYPGYRVSEGALGEYNGKFMCNQMVLRGGSFVTPLEHIRKSYRNFFYPHCRWQFMGVRLARDLV